MLGINDLGDVLQTMHVAQKIFIMIGLFQFIQEQFQKLGIRGAAHRPSQGPHEIYLILIQKAVSYTHLIQDQRMALQRGEDERKITDQKSGQEKKKADGDGQPQKDTDKRICQMCIRDRSILIFSFVEPVSKDSPHAQVILAR